MGMFDALDISGSGLSAERMRMDVSAENLANANTTRTAAGGPYRRKVVELQQQTPQTSFQTALSSKMGSGNSQAGTGVQVEGIAEDTTPNRRVYDPGNPDAGKDGYVSMPNVDSVTEMVDLISASRAYEANVTAMQSAKTMFTKTLDLLR
jgi:flagellar basal-body rod protein FlgC